MSARDDDAWWGDDAELAREVAAERRAVGPDEARRARMHAALVARIASPTPPVSAPGPSSAPHESAPVAEPGGASTSSPTGAPVATATTQSGTLGLGLKLATVGLVAATAWWAVDRAGAPTVESAGARAAVESRAGEAAAPPQPIVRPEPDRPKSPDLEAPRVFQRPVAGRAPSPPAGDPGRGQASGERAPRAGGSLSPAGPATPAGARVPPAARPTRSAPRPSDARPAPASPAVVASLDEERALLQSGRAALLRGDLGDAKSAVSAHAARFPRGQLAEARAVLNIQILVKDGRHAATQAPAARFRELYPDSLFGPALADALAAPGSRGAR